MSLQVRRGADPRTGPARELGLFRNLRHGLAAQDWLCIRHNHYPNQPPSPLRSNPTPAASPSFITRAGQPNVQGRFVSPFRLVPEAKANFVQPQSAQQKIGFVPSFCPTPDSDSPEPVPAPRRGYLWLAVV